MARGAGGLGMLVGCFGDGTGAPSTGVTAGLVSAAMLVHGALPDASALGAQAVDTVTDEEEDVALLVGSRSAAGGGALVAATIWASVLSVADIEEGAFGNDGGVCSPTSVPSDTVHSTPPAGAGAGAAR